MIVGDLRWYAPRTAASSALDRASGDRRRVASTTRATCRSVRYGPLLAASGAAFFGSDDGKLVSHCAWTTARSLGAVAGQRRGPHRYRSVWMMLTAQCRARRHHLSVLPYHGNLVAIDGLPAAVFKLWSRQFFQLRLRLRWPAT